MRNIIYLACLLAMAFGLSACANENTNGNVNANANVTVKAPSPVPTLAPTPKYSEEQAREERARAKENKETIGESLEDAWVHSKIVAKLIGDSKTPERKINVDVVKGEVTLRGTVDTAESKAEAERVTRDTEGVKKIVNQLKVAPAPAKSPTKAPAKALPQKY